MQYDEKEKIYQEQVIDKIEDPTVRRIVERSINWCATGKWDELFNILQEEAPEWVPKGISIGDVADVIHDIFREDVAAHTKSNNGNSQDDIWEYIDEVDAKEKELLQKLGFTQKEAGEIVDSYQYKGKYAAYVSAVLMNEYCNGMQFEEALQHLGVNVDDIEKKAKNKLEKAYKDAKGPKILTKDVGQEIPKREEKSLTKFEPAMSELAQKNTDKDVLHEPPL